MEAKEPTTAGVLALPERTSDDLVSWVKEKLAAVGYLADDRLSVQMALLLVTDSDMVRTALLEGPAGAGKTHLAKSMAKILGCKVLYIQAAPNSSPENFLYGPGGLSARLRLRT